MSNMIIFKPLAPSSVTVSRGTGGDNLLTPDPKEIWLDATGTGVAQTLDFDLGSSQSIDSVLLGYTNAASGAALSIQGGTAAYTTTTFSASAQLITPSGVAVPPRMHGFRRFAAPVSARYVRLNVNQPASSWPMTLGIVAIGLAFQPIYNREWGSGRQVLDTGVRESLLGGGFGIGEGARKRGLRWTLGDLSDAEVAALEDLALDRGETRPVVVVEDPTDATRLNEGIHYGLFDRFEAYERANPSQTRWSLSMTEWV